MLWPELALFCSFELVLSEPDKMLLESLLRDVAPREPEADPCRSLPLLFSCAEDSDPAPAEAAAPAFAPVLESPSLWLAPWLELDWLETLIWLFTCVTPVVCCTRASIRCFCCSFGTVPLKVTVPLF